MLMDTGFTKMRMGGAVHVIIDMLTNKNIEQVRVQPGHRYKQMLSQAKNVISN